MAGAGSARPGGDVDEDGRRSRGRGFPLRGDERAGHRLDPCRAVRAQRRVPDLATAGTAGAPALDPRPARDRVAEAAQPGSGCLPARGPDDRCLRRRSPTPGTARAWYPCSIDPDWRRYVVLHADAGRRTAGASGVQRVDGLASERGRRAVFSRRDLPVDPGATARRDLYGRRAQSERASPRRRRARRRRDDHGNGGGCAPVDRRGCRLRGAAPGWRWHEAEDLRGAGHGAAGRLDDGGRRRPWHRAGTPLLMCRHARHVRRSGRLAARGCRAARATGRGRPAARRELLLLGHDRPSLRTTL